jgi:protein phosphatase
MTVVCAACGSISRDREFCDHCNAELPARDDRLPPPRCPLPPGEVELTAAQRQALTRPTDAVTLDVVGGARWRVHWIGQEDLPAWQPYLHERLQLTLDVLPSCRAVAVEGGQWVIADAAPAAIRPWRDRPPVSDPLARVRNLLADVTALAQVLELLHQRDLLWLTFDPAAIEEVGSAGDPKRLRVTNLDVRVFHSGECPPGLRFNARYAPPEVCTLRAHEIGPATDVYHLALFAYYWCAGLLPDGFAGAGLGAFDHHIPPLRPFAPDLPEGITPTIGRGLSVAPAQRYRTPGEFLAALQASYEEAQRRRQYSAAVRWDAASMTETGSSKAALHKGNEDHDVLRTYPQPPALLAAVADGISTCDIGSGALASLVATIILENRFDAGSSHEAFPQQVAAACREGSQRVLDWALEKGYREQLVLGLDLMGTTLTVGWLQDHALSIANLGDSRAYLVTDAWIDQLTVDGDLGTELLTRGTPPEQLLHMGVVARALRSCVGGCTLNEGRVEVLPESCVPMISRWPVVPGDVVILCTDGLIEEGYFLDPEAAGALVRNHRAESPADLARRLVRAADALQRLPSLAEPEGFGDNITCIVIKIEGAVEQGA